MATGLNNFIPKDPNMISHNICYMKSMNGPSFREAPIK